MKYAFAAVAFSFVLALSLPSAQALEIDAPDCEFTFPCFFNLSKWESQSPIQGTVTNQNAEFVGISVNRSTDGWYWYGDNNWGQTPASNEVPVVGDTFDLPFSPQESADYTIKAQALDGPGGNPIPGEEETLTVVYDNEPPDAFISPPLPTWTNTDSFTVPIDGSDDHSGINRFILEYKITQGDNDVQDWKDHDNSPFLGPGPVPFPDQSASPLLNNHTYHFRLTAVDNSNNSFTAPEDSTSIDTLPPACGIDPLPPFVPGSFTLSWNVTENISGIMELSVNYSQNGDDPWFDVSGFCTPYGPFDTSTECSFSDGTWYFRCSATDNAGSTGDYSPIINTTVDRSVPTADINTLPPYTNSYVFPLSWTGTDPPPSSGIQCYNVQWANDTSGAIEPENNPPLAKPDFAETPEEVPVNINVLANDTDDGPPEELFVNNIPVLPSNGIAIIETDNTITYTPELNFFGLDTFVYEVCDIGILCDTALVTVNVTPAPINLPPIANDDSFSVVINSDESDCANHFNVLANDIDPDGNDNDLVIVNIFDGPFGGTAMIKDADGCVGRQHIEYVPNPSYCPQDEFWYTIQDPGGEQDSAFVDITITGTCLEFSGGTGDEDFGSIITFAEEHVNGVVDESFSGGVIRFAAIEEEEEEEQLDWINITNSIGGTCLNVTEMTFGDGVTPGENANEHLDMTQDNVTYFFRARAIDSVGNVGPWDGPPYENTTIDTIFPLLDLDAVDQNGVFPGQGGAVTSITVSTIAFDSISPLALHFIFIEVTKETISVFTQDCNGDSSCELVQDVEGASQVIFYAQVTDGAGNLNETFRFVFSPHPLANFVTHFVTLTLGKTIDAEVQVRNMETIPINLSLQLTRYEPAGFTVGVGNFDAYNISADGRSVDITNLQAGGTGTFTVELIATDPDNYDPILNLTALSSTGITDEDIMQISLGFPAAFSGLNEGSLAFLLLFTLLAYFLLTKKRD